MFFGGAGVSTESGIPDFRSQNGIFSKKTQGSQEYATENTLSHSFFLEHTEKFYEFYRSFIIYKDAKPNRAHYRLAQLEKDGKLKAVITQNVDGLHQAAGSENVIELHGSIHRNNCMKCGKVFDLSIVLESKGIPTCFCGSIIKPDVVLYEEGLDKDVLSNGMNALKKADLLIIGGTSLLVYPAAGLIDFFKNGKIIIINQSITPFDNRADLVINAPIGEALAINS